MNEREMKAMDKKMQGLMVPPGYNNIAMIDVMHKRYREYEKLKFIIKEDNFNEDNNICETKVLHEGLFPNTNESPYIFNELIMVDNNTK